MHVERFGNGPRHFLGLHGWNGTTGTFRPLVNKLPADVTFWAVDLPGCGQSPLPSPLNPESVMQPLEKWLSRSPDTMNITGNCSGAIFALLLAQRFPQQVRRVTMIDAFCTTPWYFQLFLWPVAGEMAYYTAFANPVGRAIANLSLSSKRAAETDLTAGFEHTDHAANLAYLRVFQNAAALMDFQVISTPVDLIYGEKTFAAVRKSIPFFQSHLRVERVECLRGAGHLPLLEATQQIGAFLFAPEEPEGIPCIKIPIHLPVTVR
jgi:pimeloyl-ACP methyl ester carboxylesterase